MKISLDAGALCTKKRTRFGNFVFTENLIQALNLYDKKNDYFIYSFCPKPEWLNLKNHMFYKVLHPRTLWLSSRVSLEEMMNIKDIFLALNQAIPIATMGEVISFSHGLSFHFFPELYPDSYFALRDQLEPMIKRSKYVILSSIKVKREMQKLFPYYSNFVVINYGIPFDMSEYTKTKKEKYFLYVGMDHKIKNLTFLIRSFNEFRKNNRYKSYKLLLVGNLEKYKNEQNNIFVLNLSHRSELKNIYAKASGYLTCSLYESFNFPVLEALSQKCAVSGLASAIIPELKKYVYVSNDIKGFIDNMNKIADNQGEFNINLDNLRMFFSWKKYANKLVRLCATKIS
ncbi:MAG: glycosyltransferase [Cyanobacteria bacterium]|nr:glycosyltransferase [Cyanobacteriota bacterium]